MDKKKIFKSNYLLDIFYEVQDEKWIDNNTYVIVFQDMKDCDNDTYHLEVEYHKDEDKITYTKVYEHETQNVEFLITNGFKTQFEEYILKKVGRIAEDSMITNSIIEVTLKIVLPLNMTVSEYQNWLENIEIQINNKNNEVQILDIKKK